MILALPVDGLEYREGNLSIYRLSMEEAVSLHNWCIGQRHFVRLRLTEDPDCLRVIVIKPRTKVQP